MGSGGIFYIPGYYIKDQCVPAWQASPGGYYIPCPCNTSCLCEYYPMTQDEKDCLDQRKYWCFLLSSIVTFSFFPAICKKVRMP